MRLAVLLSAAMLSLHAGCFSPREVFVCSRAEQCERAGASGTCEADGHCSYPDEGCASGRRYGSTAAEPGTCVAAGSGDQISDAGIDLPDARVITGCESDDDCAPLTDACGVGACDRTTGICAKLPGEDGTGCGAASCSTFGSCGGFDDLCDVTGSQSRTCVPRVCSRGDCAGGTAYVESQTCTREDQCGGSTVCYQGACCQPTGCSASEQCGWHNPGCGLPEYLCGIGNCGAGAECCNGAWCAYGYDHYCSIDVDCCSQNCDESIGRCR